MTVHLAWGLHLELPRSLGVRWALGAVGVAALPATILLWAQEHPLDWLAFTAAIVCTLAALLHVDHDLGGTFNLEAPQDTVSMVNSVTDEMDHLDLDAMLRDQQDERMDPPSAD